MASTHAPAPAPAAAPAPPQWCPNHKNSLGTPGAWFYHPYTIPHFDPNDPNSVHWEEKKDPRGIPYYCNHTTKTTQYAHPNPTGMYVPPKVEPTVVHNVNVPAPFPVVPLIGGTAVMGIGGVLHFI